MSAGHVQEGPDRQPRRDRAADPPRVQGDGHPDGGGALHRGFERDARPDGRRERLHRAAAGGPELPLDAEHHRRLRDHRRRGGASGLRLPQREREVRADLRGPRDQVHRADLGAYPADGRQDHRQGDDEEPRRPLRAGIGRRGADARGRAPGGGRDRLSGDREGDGRRRRARDEARASRRRRSTPPSRPRGRRRRRRSATTRSTSRSTSAPRGTSRCRSSATARARRCTSASATARCSGGTRR